MKPWALLLAFAAAAACRALPSAIPLSDSGVAAAPSGANDRDRRAAEPEGDEDSGDRAGEGAVAAAAPPAAPVPPAADAGAGDAAPDAPADAGNEKNAAAAPQWPGEYYGSDRFVRRVESEPDEVQVDDKARTRVEQPSPTSLVISIVNSLNGDVICALRAGVQGSEATLEPGQSCFESEELEARVTSGRAKLSGDVLTLDFEGKLLVGDEESIGSDTYHFEGRRR